MSSNARKELCKKFLSVLKKGTIPWEQGWGENVEQVNPITKTKYNGITNMILSLENRKSNQWITLSQSKKQGWVLKKGVKPVIVERFIFENRKNPEEVLSVESYARRVLEGVNVAFEYNKVLQSYYLYNLDDFENVPEVYRAKTKPTAKTKKQEDFVSKLPAKLGVLVFEDSTIESGAYYDPNKDEVHLPPKEKFKSVYSYNAVKLHELCHSTSQKKRLDRSYLYKSREDMNFGSAGYAKEELRAEIASAFLMQDIGLQPDKSELTNHLGYVQSWIKVLEKNENELSKAIDDAYKIEDYILNA